MEWADLALVFAIFAHNMTNSLQTTFMGIIIKGFDIRLIRLCCLISRLRLLWLSRS